MMWRRRRAKAEREPVGARIALRTTIDGRPFTIYIRPGGWSGGFTDNGTGGLLVNGEPPSPVEVKRGWMWAR